MRKQIKIGIIISPGGHLYKTYQLKDWWDKCDRFWVTNRRVAKKMSLLKREKVYQGYFPENRNFINFFKNLVLAGKILKIERPKFLFSMGAGIAPPFFLAAKFLGIKLIFMETFTLIDHPTLTGKMVYPFSDLFLVQNKKLLRYFPKGKFLGSTL